MARYNIRPYDDYKAWDTAETIEEARDKRSKLAIIAIIAVPLNIYLISFIIFHFKRSRALSSTPG